MKLTKAIEILTAMKDKTHIYSEQDIKDTLRLGIEALKREDKRRRFAIPDKVDLLPGETEE